MPGEMRLRVWDVEHGACVMVRHINGNLGGRLAMIDSGCTDDWTPSNYIRNELGLDRLDYLFITNADQDHMSDLQGLWDSGIHVGTFFRNSSYTGAQYRAIKERGGRLTSDAERYEWLCNTYTHPVTHPFNDSMDGITARTFSATYPRFNNTNDLSLAVFIEFGGVRFLFPGDLEKAGWLALLENQDFRAQLAGTHILMASHHGRENGFCPEVFDLVTPHTVIISDKPIEHATQEMVPDYRNVVRNDGVYVRTTNSRRHVLTTRRDGWIGFNVYPDGTYNVFTENGG